jgi:hypothetical protein
LCLLASDSRSSKLGNDLLLLVDIVIELTTNRDHSKRAGEVEFLRIDNTGRYTGVRYALLSWSIISVAVLIHVASRGWPTRLLKPRPWLLYIISINATTHLKPKIKAIGTVCVYNGDDPRVGVCVSVGNFPFYAHTKFLMYHTHPTMSACARTTALILSRSTPVLSHYTCISILISLVVVEFSWLGC